VCIMSQMRFHIFVFDLSSVEEMIWVTQTADNVLVCALPSIRHAPYILNEQRLYHWLYSQLGDLDRNVNSRSFLEGTDRYM
jgi:hypothetical protein